jgi:hypothetical protein
LARALARDPADRYRSAQALWVDLASLSRILGPPVTTTEVQRLLSA